MKGGYGHDFKIKNGDASCAGPETAYDTVKNCSIRCSGNLTTGHTVAIQGTSEADIATLYLATPNTTQNPYWCILPSDSERHPRLHDQGTTIIVLGIKYKYIIWYINHIDIHINIYYIGKIRK